MQQWGGGDRRNEEARDREAERVRNEQGRCRRLKGMGRRKQALDRRAPYTGRNLGKAGNRQVWIGELQAERT